MVINESRLLFDFPPVPTIKFDETPFYCQHFSQQPAGKGVDVLSINDKYLILMEIKNCSGHENDNLWRITCNNDTTNKSTQSANRETFDVEIAKKVAMTVSCLVGAYSKQDASAAARELAPFANHLVSQGIRTNHKKLLVIFFLEGNFSCATRSKRTIMRILQESLHQKLNWLNCHVSVVDSTTYNHKIFTLR